MSYLGEGYSSCLGGYQACGRVKVTFAVGTVYHTQKVKVEAATWSVNLSSFVTIS